MTIEWKHYGRYSVISQLEQRNKTHLTHTERQAHERELLRSILYGGYQLPSTQCQYCSLDYVSSQNGAEEPGRSPLRAAHSSEFQPALL